MRVDVVHGIWYMVHGACPSSIRMETLVKIVSGTRAKWKGTSYYRAWGVPICNNLHITLVAWGSYLRYDPLYPVYPPFAVIKRVLCVRYRKQAPISMLIYLEICLRARFFFLHDFTTLCYIILIFLILFLFLLFSLFNNYNTHFTDNLSFFLLFSLLDKQ